VDPPPDHGLIVLVGLTGAGKSTAVAALRSAGVRLELLPNRRDLADAHVLPEAQRLAGEPATTVRDRLQRFRLTARYREAYPGGLAHALERWLGQSPGRETGATRVFDNLRGEGEVAYAVGVFPTARFVVLEADAATRVLRIAGRRDAFDRAGAVAASRSAPSPVAPSGRRGVAAEPPSTTAGAPAWTRVPGLDELVDLPRLMIAADGLDRGALERAARVVVEENRHYDPEAAWRLLAPLPAARRLRLDSTRLTPEEVAAAVRAWW